MFILLYFLSIIVCCIMYRTIYHIVQCLLLILLFISNISYFISYFISLYISNCIVHQINFILFIGDVIIHCISAKQIYHGYCIVDITFDCKLYSIIANPKAWQKPKPKPGRLVL